MVEETVTGAVDVVDVFGSRLCGPGSGVVRGGDVKVKGQGAWRLQRMPKLRGEF